MKKTIILGVAPDSHNLPKECRCGISAETVSQDVIACAAQGASVVHLHVRDQLGQQTDDLTVYDTWDLAERIYCEMLMHETEALLEITPADPPTDADAPLPRIHGHLDYTDEPYTTYFWAEQIPIALAAFVFGHGKPESLPICINIGRDCDTTGTTIGAWLGALHGMDCLPKEWVDQVCSANSKEMDLMLLAQQICEVTL